MSPRHYWPIFVAACLYLLCSGCRHTWNRTAGVSKAAVQITETARSETKDETRVEEKKGGGIKRTQRFDRVTGKLVEDVLEQYQSDGRITVVEATKKAEEIRDTKKLNEQKNEKVNGAVGSHWPWWLLCLIPAAAVLFALRRFPSLSVPGIARALAARFVRARR